MKRNILIAALLALALLLSGCTAANPPEATLVPETAAPETAAPETAVPEAGALETAVPAAETVTEAPAAETAAPETAAAETAAPAKEQPFLVEITEDDPSIAYVLVRLTDYAGLLPLPQEGEYIKTVRQLLTDGSEYVNVLHVTPEGFWMEESNCEGHDCINEGEVTLSNREERPLWNMVICLPHRLSAELVTRAEAEQLLGIQPSGN